MNFQRLFDNKNLKNIDILQDPFIIKKMCLKHHNQPTAFPNECVFHHDAIIVIVQNTDTYEGEILSRRILCSIRCH